MSRDEFKTCDKYGLIRSYSMREDFTIQAKQVEDLLVKLDEKIEDYKGMLGEASEEKAKTFEETSKDLIKMVKNYCDQRDLKEEKPVEFGDSLRTALGWRS